MNCPICNSPTNKKESFLGRLGGLDHYRCRYCGCMWNKPVPLKKMKKLGIYGIMMVLAANAFAQYPLNVPNEDAFFKALSWEESKNNPNAVGDRHLKNMAYGTLQIRSVYLDDVNRLAGKDVQKVWGKPSLVLEDVKNPEIARWAARVYLHSYGVRYQKITGKKPDAGVYARMHNGGPNGWKKESTEAYLRSFMKILQKEMDF